MSYGLFNLTVFFNMAKHWICEVLLSGYVRYISSQLDIESSVIKKKNWSANMFWKRATGLKLCYFSAMYSLCLQLPNQKSVILILLE
jgi:hypothetical protein